MCFITRVISPRLLYSSVNFLPTWCKNRCELTDIDFTFSNNVLRKCAFTPKQPKGSSENYVTPFWPKFDPPPLLTPKWPFCVQPVPYRNTLPLPDSTTWTDLKKWVILHTSPLINGGMKHLQNSCTYLWYLPTWSYNFGGRLLHFFRKNCSPKNKDPELSPIIQKMT